MVQLVSIHQAIDRRGDDIPPPPIVEEHLLPRAVQPQIELRNAGAGGEQYHVHNHKHRYNLDYILHLRLLLTKNTFCE